MKISVVIPVHNGGNNLRECLKALMDSTRRPDELIIVDDASTDESAQLASKFGTVIAGPSPKPVGPARARNLGVASSQGDVLLFLDADVVVHPNTLALIESHFNQYPQIAALFGAYDDDPPHRNWVSLYKNLQHHFVHRQSQPEASSFWTGAGAIRREVFYQLGGFNESYSRPSIEDIELGVRLRELGHRVRLCTDVQVTHLKRWTLFSLLRSDILDRAVPWTRLIFSSSRLPTDLNLDLKSRLSALCAWFVLLLSVIGLWAPAAWLGALLLLGIVIASNFTLYHFFYERGGLWFTAAAVALHFLYFLYSSITFVFVWIECVLLKKNQKISVSHGSVGD